MPGAGTDKTKRWLATPAPVVVLVESQLGENIGAAARAMANFGLSRLRLVKPLQGWPNERAKVMAAGADRILDAAVLYERVGGGRRLLLRPRDHRAHARSGKAGGHAAEAAPRWRRGSRAARRSRIVFGRERNGLENHEVGLADRILTLPVNPAFASLNLAQAVIIVAYEWFKRAARRSAVRQPDKSPPAAQAAARSILRRSRARTGKGRVLPSGREAQRHAGQPAQHLPAHGSRRSRTSARCMASSPRSSMAAKVPRAAACSMAKRRRGCAN